MSKIITIDLLRHGEPEGGEVLRGRINHPLSELGWQQMKTSVAIVADKAGASESLPWTHIVSSPLKRCHAFAELLATAHNIPLHVEPDWQEIDYGNWDGLPLSEWRQLAAPQFRAFRNDLSKLSPPEGEPYLVFKDRVLKALARLGELADGSRVLLITHGGVMRVVLPTVLNIPLNNSSALHIPFACRSRIRLHISADKTSSSFLAHNMANF